MIDNSLLDPAIVEDSVTRMRRRHPDPGQRLAAWIGTAEVRTLTGAEGDDAMLALRQYGERLAKV